MDYAPAGVTVSPAEYWKNLKLQKNETNFTKDVFYKSIVLTLCNNSFSPRVSSLQDSLLLAIPMIHKRILETSTSNLSLEIAYSVAKVVGLFGIVSRNRKDESKLLFEASLIVLIAFQENVLRESGVKIYSSLSDFLSEYPQFRECNSDEQKLLFEFANWMKYAIIAINPKYRKAHLLDLVTRITEGQRAEKAKYITGGGQTSATSRRVQIYEKEGGITRIPWPVSRKLPFLASKEDQTTPTDSTISDCGAIKLDIIGSTATSSERKEFFQIASIPPSISSDAVFSFQQAALPEHPQIYQFQYPESQKQIGPGPMCPLVYSGVGGKGLAGSGPAVQISAERYTNHTADIKCNSNTSVGFATLGATSAPGTNDSTQQTEIFLNPLDLLYQSICIVEAGQMDPKVALPYVERALGFGAGAGTISSADSACSETVSDDMTVSSSSSLISTVSTNSTISMISNSGSSSNCARINGFGPVATQQNLFSTVPSPTEDARTADVGLSMKRQRCQ